MNKKEKVIKTGLIGELTDVKLFCNEKDKNRGKFLFKCGKGCEHDTPSPEKYECECGEEVENGEHICSEKWEEEFDSLLGFASKELKWKCKDTALISTWRNFIQKTLTTQRESIIEECIGSLPKEKAWGGYDGEEIINNKESLGYNQAILETITKLNKLKNK